MPEEAQEKIPMAGANLGAVGRSPLHWVWICDISDSMNMNGKIDRLNEAIQKGNEALKKYNETRDFKIFIHTLKFSTGAEWVEKDFISVTEYEWKPLTADGVTDLGAAFSKLADAMRFKNEGGLMPEKRCKRPHMVLITDGYPVDDWQSGLNKLNETYWGKMAVRMAVTLPGDPDMDVLREFVGKDAEAQKRLVTIDDPSKLIDCIIEMSEQVQRVTGENYGPGTRAPPKPVPPADAPVIPPPDTEPEIKPDDQAVPEPADSSESEPPDDLEYSPHKDQGDSPPNQERGDITKIPEDVEFHK